MIRLSTAIGAAYLKSVDLVDAIGPTKPGTKQYPIPTRVVMLHGGVKLYISDTPENMRLLVGSDYVPDQETTPKAKKRAKKVETE